jgi:two-component system OmpR family sensor kinase
MSLRLRLVLGLGLVALVLVAVAVVVTRSTQEDLLAKVDEQLRSASEDPSFELFLRGAADEGGPGFGPGGGRPPWMEYVERARGPATLWTGELTDGQVVTNGGPVDADGRAVVPTWTEDQIAALRPGQRLTVGGVGADRFRVLAVEGSHGRLALIGSPIDDVDDSVRQLIVVEAVATGLALALLGLVALWVLRLGVRPIQQMTATATAIAAGDLSQRVPEADPKTEAGELGVALNSMLTHIEGAFAASTASEDRLRRFVADASHELRTPITTIRGYAELHRRGGLEDPEALASAMARTEQEAVRMGRLVEDLLLLARLDQGRPLEADPVDLGGLVTDARDDAAAAHPDHPVALEVDEGCIVVGDDHRLRQVVGNLLANAVAHTPAGTAITLRVQAVADDARRVALEVVDAGPGMAPDLAERAFERFARGDVARSRAAGSTGLGLSIVQAIVAAHGGTVALESVVGSGTTVRVVLPRDGTLTVAATTADRGEL